MAVAAADKGHALTFAHRPADSRVVVIFLRIFICTFLVWAAILLLYWSSRSREVLRILN